MSRLTPIRNMVESRVPAATAIHTLLSEDLVGRIADQAMTVVADKLKTKASTLYTNTTVVYGLLLVDVNNNYLSRILKYLEGRGIRLRKLSSLIGSQTQAPGYITRRNKTTLVFDYPSLMSITTSEQTNI